jgi:hypothetical protein
MDQGQFYELHASCVDAFQKYANEANATATLLAQCTAEPLPLTKRLKIALQEQTENTAHILYLSAKDSLHETARLGYAFTDIPM